MNPLWDTFVTYDLRQVMRQNDAKFIDALTNLALGTMTEENINLFKSRVFLHDVDVPLDAIRLYHRRKDVRSYNNTKIDQSPEPEIKSYAQDVVLGKISESKKSSTLTLLQNKDESEVGGLSFVVRLKIGIKYMLTSNIDIEDGLVNGTSGVLKLVTFNNKEEIDKLWLDFLPNENVGFKARQQNLVIYNLKNIPSHLTPLSKKSFTISGNKEGAYQIVRNQFPIMPAEALTIHKSQGQTYASICVDLSTSEKTKYLTRSLLYVALISTVSSLSGLYILGSFIPPDPPKPNDVTLREIERLKNHRQLRLSFHNLSTTCISVAYQNVRSLNKNVSHILSDAWYFRNNVICFAETFTVNTDVILIPGFHCFYRSDNYIERKPRGLMCFVKVDESISVVHTEQVNDGNHHIDLILFQLGSTSFITGYKSPKTPDPVFFLLLF